MFLNFVGYSVRRTPATCAGTYFTGQHGFGYGFDQPRRRAETLRPQLGIEGWLQEPLPALAPERGGALGLRDGRRVRLSTPARVGLNHRLPKERFDVGYSQGPGIEEPLTTIALGLLQEQQLLPHLDALGQGLYGQLPRYRTHRGLRRAIAGASG